METFDNWEKKYTAIENPDTSASFSGVGFETFGVDLETVKSYSPSRIWTVIEAEENLYLVSGFSVVNRIAYIISTEPVLEEDKDKAFLFD